MKGGYDEHSISPKEYVFAVLNETLRGPFSYCLVPFTHYWGFHKVIKNLDTILASILFICGLWPTFFSKFQFCFFCFSNKYMNLH